MHINQKVNITENVMSIIKKGRAKIKPRWRFVLGSLAMVGGLVGLIVLTLFTVSLITFSLRTHGPMGAVRFEQLLSTFPWWAPIAAIIGVVLSVKLLKKYDFSYKKNFLLIIVGFVVAVLLVGWLIDYTGLDNNLMRGGPMKELYQRYHGGGAEKRPGWQIIQENENIKL